MITRFTNINVFNTSQRQFELLDVYIKDTIFYYIGNDIIPYDALVDGQGRYMIPGLIDSHMHIESSMTTPQEFSNTVLPLGTTTILADAHEVGNVFGYDGLVEYMNQTQRLDVFYAIPSSVPSTNPSLETTGGYVDETIVSKLALHPKVIALGEIMNFKDLTSDEDTLTKRIVSTFKEVKPNHPIEGHIPRISGLGLSKFIMQGIGSDHTQQTPQSLLEKTRNGLIIQLQEKSLNRALVETIIDYDLFNFVSLVTDDVMPDDLLNKGHLNHLIKKCISYGMKPVDAIYIATHTPAQRIQRFDRGMIAPGKIADAVILESLEHFEIYDVLKSGKSVNQLSKDPIPSFHEASLNSIKRAPLSYEDFVVTSSKAVETVRIMSREMGSTFTQEKHIQVPVKDGLLSWKECGLNLICVIERYGHNAPLKFGFVENGFDKPCALATSWAHDHHNILVMGNDIQKIVDAVNTIIVNQGGIICINDESVFAPLSYGGIVSLEPMDVLATKIEKIRDMMAKSGYISHNEIMSFCVLSLLVSPEIKISDKGYVNTTTQEILDWSV
ncbi:adenosine deaminase [Erysipelothrix larvae]|uniref:Adenine deaminase n=1 Tax=Erysipelothrix larvae TaxID=1514105 RepID=A0A109UH25_9FIRM|nr:adenine deaminase C-terminal domain-containing protein [Erysipelothrix larvae]AMC93483.1 adenosine deaminase [Erysipelothrix larvae]